MLFRFLITPASVRYFRNDSFRTLATAEILYFLPDFKTCLVPGIISPNVEAVPSLEKKLQ